MNFGHGDIIAHKEFGTARIVCSYQSSTGQIFHFAHVQCAQTGVVVFLGDDARMSLSQSGDLLGLLGFLNCHEAKVLFPIEAAVEGKSALREFLIKAAEGQYPGLGAELTAHLLPSETAL